MVAKHDDFLEIGIEDPSGLSIHSTGLIGQFLGCVEYKIDEVSFPKSFKLFKNAILE